MKPIPPLGSRDTGAAGQIAGHPSPSGFSLVVEASIYVEKKV